MNILTLTPNWRPAVLRALGSFGNKAAVISYDDRLKSWTHQVSRDVTSDPETALSWARLHHHGCPIVVWDNVPQKQFAELYRHALSESCHLPQLIVATADWVQESGPEEHKILSLAILEDPEAYLVASFAYTLLAHPI